jgi:pyruvate/2-oxoglutarate/acetoin dehydrogenase E1 component
MAVVGEALDRVRLRAPMRRIAVPDVPIPYSRVLEQAVIPQVQDLVQAVRDTLAADFERHGRATADA